MGSHSTGNIAINSIKAQLVERPTSLSNGRSSQRRVHSLTTISPSPASSDAAMATAGKPPPLPSRKQLNGDSAAAAAAAAAAVNGKDKGGVHYSASAAQLSPSVNGDSLSQATATSDVRLPSGRSSTPSGNRQQQQQQQQQQKQQHNGDVVFSENVAATKNRPIQNGGLNGKDATHLATSNGYVSSPPPSGSESDDTSWGAGGGGANSGLDHSQGSSLSDWYMRPFHRSPSSGAANGTAGAVLATSTPTCNGSGPAAFLVGTPQWSDGTPITSRDGPSARHALMTSRSTSMTASSSLEELKREYFPHTFGVHGAGGIGAMLPPTPESGDILPPQFGPSRRSNERVSGSRHSHHKQRERVVNGNGLSGHGHREGKQEREAGRAGGHSGRRPHSAQSSSSSTSLSSMDRVNLMTVRSSASNTATNGGLVGMATLYSSPYEEELTLLRLENLRLEEQKLLQCKRQEELERIRGPRVRWYELRDSSFGYEVRKNTELVRNASQAGEMLEYRRQLESLGNGSAGKINGGAI